MPHPHRIEEDGLPVLVVRLEQREVARMYERIETTNPPTQHVNPRYAHSAKGGPRLAAASAEKGICLRAEKRRGAISRTQSHSRKLNRTRAGGVGRA